MVADSEQSYRPEQRSSHLVVKIKIKVLTLILCPYQQIHSPVSRSPCPDWSAPQLYA